MKIFAEKNNQIEKNEDKRRRYRVLRHLLRCITTLLWGEEQDKIWRSRLQAWSLSICPSGLVGWARDDGGAGGGGGGGVGRLRWALWQTWGRWRQLNFYPGHRANSKWGGACYKSSLSAWQSAEAVGARADVGFRCSFYWFALSAELCKALSERAACSRVLCGVVRGYGRL